MHPKEDIVNFPCHHFSINVDGWKAYMNCATIFTGRKIIEFFPKFIVLSQSSQHIFFMFTVEKWLKNPPLWASHFLMSIHPNIKIVSAFEILWAVDRRDLCQGRLTSRSTYVDNPKVPDGLAAPGEINAHKLDTPGDPMREMKIVFTGDQLT